jgi:iron complex outermembrane receptor protein
MRIFQFRAVLCATAVGFGLWAGTASAQAVDNAAPQAGDDTGQLGDIIVTAQKRAENMQKIPVAVVSFDAEALTAANIRTAEELGRLTPGLTMTRGDRTLTPYLRGVGSDVNTIGFESSVAVYVDGVYFSRLASGILGLSDVERVEVLKGPQGTLFGRNASAGLINVITAEPSLDQAAGKFTLGYGNYERVEVNGRVSVPLSDKVAVSMAGSYSHQGKGIGTNVVTGGKNIFDQGITLRGKLLFEPSDTTKIVLTGYYMNSLFSDKGNTYPGTTQGFGTAPYAGFGPIGFYDHREDLDSRQRAKVYGGSLKIVQDLGFATLTSITAGQHLVETNVSDVDYLPRFEFVYTNTAPQDTFSQEVQLASPSGGKFQWTTGLFYYYNKGKYEPILFRGPLVGVLFGFPGLEAADIYGQQTAKSYAAYAQGSYKLTDQLTATLGGRFTHDKVVAGGRVDVYLPPNGTLFPGAFSSDTTTGDRFTFRAALDYQITPDALVYASFNRGYKAGTYGVLPFNPTPAKPEVLDAYEVGFKTEFFDRHVRLNGAAFWYDIKSPQILIIDTGQAVVANAVSARVKGAEVDLEIAATRELTLRLAGSYVDGKYGSFTNAPSYSPNPNLDPLLGPVGGLIPTPATPTTAVGQTDASGTRMVRSPKVQFTASANYAVETGAGKLALNVNYAYTGSFFWHPDHAIKQKSFGLLGARAGLTLDNNIEFSIWGRNLTKEKYATFVIEVNGSGGYPYTPGSPRTYGATIGYSF